MKMKKEAEQAEVNIGLIGHVDHGKTSITQALSGKWTDTHSEELKRGISIRLGYADTVFYKCPDCKGAEAFSTKEKCPNCEKKGKKLRKVSFVDAPGHETLMTTMLSGAALMHGAILVIAANEFCPQPRTKEHLMALKISGIKNIVVAQNKIDLVDKKKAEENYKQIKNFLKEFEYEKVEIIPTAAHFGTNMDLLIEAIEKNIPSPKVDEKKPVKMFIARSFDINKPGAKPKEIVGGVLGGTILQGKIEEGDELELSPGINNKKTKIKVVELSTAGGTIKKAVPGGLISVKTLIDPNLTKNDQMKGNVLGKIGTVSDPVSEIKMKLNYFKREITDKKNEVKQGEIIVLSAGTATTIGTIVSLKKDLIDVTLKVPISVDKGQRIAVSIKDATRWRLIAYGEIQ
ncbi:MAG: translation initiation factor IF-2 subunit gamma [Candidatus Diapherotrites archaeon CG10_big_fil_rev_8_21_14_0_10_31_34]|nr:MAG: translation initiation factor IF-2 subunit gamma [Candidatus Diapherotrites archaeon CG10_big_fil_rev_8_21_14_0_10_31_34]